MSKINNISYFCCKILLKICYIKQQQQYLINTNYNTIESKEQLNILLNNKYQNWWNEIRITAIKQSTVKLTAIARASVILAEQTKQS